MNLKNLKLGQKIVISSVQSYELLTVIKKRLLSIKNDTKQKEEILKRAKVGKSSLEPEEIKDLETYLFKEKEEAKLLLSILPKLEKLGK